MWKRSENLKAVNAEWHLFRENARQIAFSKEEFSDSEQVEFDLDTADITGKDNNRNYQYSRPLTSVDGTPNNGTDVRTLDNR